MHIADNTGPAQSVGCELHESSAVPPSCRPNAHARGAASCAAGRILGTTNGTIVLLGLAVVTFVLAAMGFLPGLKLLLELGRLCLVLVLVGFLLTSGQRLPTFTCGLADGCDVRASGKALLDLLAVAGEVTAEGA